ncbi:hypothetical protein AN1V17_50680 [Vallitalea sediminicola]
MPKANYIRIVLVIIFLLTIEVACTNDSIESSNPECREMYFKDINDDITLIYKEGFEYSYYYNLDSEYELIFELVLYKDNIMIDNIELIDIKKDIGDIDGTFGISVNMDEEKESLVWTIRHDEKTKSTVSSNFFKNIMGSHGSYMDGGLISSEGNLIIDDEYES